MTSYSATRRTSAMTIFEAVTWALGLIGVGAYFGLRTIIDQQHLTGLEQFTQARETIQQLASENDRRSSSIAEPAILGTTIDTAGVGADLGPGRIGERSRAAEGSGLGGGARRPAQGSAGATAMLMPATPDTSQWSQARIAAHSAAAASADIPEAVLRVARLKMEVPIYPGITEQNLNRGAARVDSTAGFEQVGNVGIAAHRDGYFRALQYIELGDLIEVQTLSEAHRYRVTRIEIVKPHETHVLASTPAPSLTLITCYPFYYLGPAPQRFIVRAERLESANRLKAARDMAEG